MFGKHFAYEYAGSNEEGWTPPWLRREADWQGPRHHGHGHHEHGGHRHEHGTSRLDMEARLGLAHVSLCGAAHLGMEARLDMEGHLGLAVQEKARVSSGVEISSLRCWSFCKSDLCMGMR